MHPTYATPLPRNLSPYIASDTIHIHTLLLNYSVFILAHNKEHGRLRQL